MVTTIYYLENWIKGFKLTQDEFTMTVEVSSEKIYFCRIPPQKKVMKCGDTLKLYRFIHFSR